MLILTGHIRPWSLGRRPLHARSHSFMYQFWRYKQARGLRNPDTQGHKNKCSAHTTLVATRGQHKATNPLVMPTHSHKGQAPSTHTGLKEVGAPCLANQSRLRRPRLPNIKVTTHSPGGENAPGRASTDTQLSVSPRDHIQFLSFCFKDTITNLYQIK